MSNRLPVHFVRRLAGCLVLVVVAGCRAPEPPPPADEIVARAVDAMTGLPGFAFSIDRSGGPAYIDVDETVSFSRAEGTYVAPDSAAAAVRVVLPGIVAEISVIAIGDRYWETHPLTRAWVEVPSDQAFNPAALFDAARGLPAILLDDLHSVALAEADRPFELEEVPGVEFYLVVADLDTTDLYPLTFGLIGPEVARVQLLVEPGSFLLHRLTITEPAAAPDQEPSVWQVDFWDFGETVVISPP
ncbi:MAG TPA: LppX_LprAFG lipoprotein [Anaerolineales bacterium]|nr:LppX_LprAFG lipoprotein [Anaerolineales bacterium]